MKNHFYILIFFFITAIANSQCNDLAKLTHGGTWKLPDTDSIAGTREYFYRNGPTEFCCDIKSIQKFADVILDKSKTYIINRTNGSFFNELDFQDLTVIYHDYDKIYTTDENLYDLSNSGRISYWLTYELMTPEKGRYIFGLEYDQNGELLSDSKFPDFGKNPNAGKINNPCEAIKIVTANEKFKNRIIESVSLVYDSETNSFCWLVKEDAKKRLFEKEDFEFEKLYRYSSLWFYVNTSSNKLEHVKTVESQSVFCGISGKKKKKKK
jgi:hypothetical protein